MSYPIIHAIELAVFALSTDLSLNDKDLPRTIGRVWGVNVPLLVGSVSLTIFYELEAEGNWAQFFLLVAVTAMLISLARVTKELNSTLKTKIERFTERRDLK